MTWTQAIVHWRSLSAETKIRIRWDSIPTDVAQSMAFEGEPVDLRTLHELHSKFALPKLMPSTPINAARSQRDAKFGKP